MIGSDLEGADLKTRVASWTLRSTGRSRSTRTSSCRSSQRGLLRHLAGPPPGFGHVPHPLAVVEYDAAPAVTLIYLPVQGPSR
jgi:hypothetical protein